MEARAADPCQLLQVQLASHILLPVGTAVLQLMVCPALSLCGRCGLCGLSLYSTWHFLETWASVHEDSWLSHPNGPKNLANTCLAVDVSVTSLSWHEILKIITGASAT